MNIVAVSGNVTRDIELKTTPNGVSVAKFDIAVRRPKVQDTTDFFKVVCWRNTAEFVSKYFKKGSRIEVKGILTKRSYEDSNGNKRVAIEIVAEDVGFGESARENGSTQQAANAPQTNSTDDFTDVSGIEDEDIPF